MEAARFDDEAGPRRKRPRRKKASAAGTGADGSTEDKAVSTGPKVKRSNPPSQTVFVGQLAYTTTEEQLRAHFAAVPGMSGPPTSVRLLAEKGTGKSRGMAFVQMAGEADVHTALKALHKSLLGGRRINVERTVGGGGTATTRVEKIKKLRTIQDASINRRVQSLVDAVVAEFGGDEETDEAADAHETMGLRASDVDERAREFLSTVSEDIARDALRDFAESAARKVDNRPAFLMGVLKRFVEERSAEEAKAKETARGKGGRGGRGGGRDGGRGGSGRGSGGRGGGRDGGRGGGGDGVGKRAGGEKRRREF